MIVDAKSNYIINQQAELVKDVHWDARDTAFIFDRLLQHVNEKSHHTNCFFCWDIKITFRVTLKRFGAAAPEKMAGDAPGQLFL